MSAPKQTCAMCGQGGYWVGYSAEHGEDRCVNHLGREPSESMSDRSNAQIIAEAREALAHYDAVSRVGYGAGDHQNLAAALRAVVAALEAEGRLTPAVQGDAKLLQNSDEREALAKLLYESAPEGGRQGIEWHEWEAMEAESGHTFVRDSYRKQADVIAAGWRLTPDNWEYGREAPEDEGYESGIWLIDTPKVRVDGVTHRRRPPGEWEPIGG